MQWCRDSFVFTNERPLAAEQATFDLLQSTYWAGNRPRQVVEKLLRTSLCFFLIYESEQVGFARVITDYATTSWICDVVVDSNYRNKGLGSWMMQCVLEHPEIAHTQFALQTGTAHDFYRRLGFRANESLMSTPVDYL